VAKLPKPPREVPACCALDVLAPRFRAAVERMLVAMREAGYTPRVAETLRTPERQSFLYGFGRDYDDGRGVVTKAPTSDTSWHGYGLAVDVVCAKRGWSAPDEFWRCLGAAARDEGLEWGGGWKFRDLPHVQWGKPMALAPSARAVALRDEGGLPAVWRAVGAADA
jgi:peptidoglycan L-alanyl-D-glutamate endopeptidase CwlK